jgi:hypothetical protein
MRTTDLQAPVADPTAGEPLAAWQWLIADEVTPVLVAALGDVFVRNAQGEIWLLDTYGGLYARAAVDEKAWRAALEDSSKVEEWFAPAFVALLRDRGLHPEPEECYSPQLPPVVGGAMDPDNFECSPWLLHIGLSGQLHEKSRQYADGSKIARFVIEPE